MEHVASSLELLFTPKGHRYEVNYIITFIETDIYIYMILQNKNMCKNIKTFDVRKGNDLKSDVPHMSFIPFVPIISFPIEMGIKLKLSSQNLYIRDTI